MNNELQISCFVKIVNQRGLHARAAAKFVKLADQFDCKVIVKKDDMSVLATSIMGLLMLAATLHSTIELQATGSQAQEALNALSHLVKSKFDEE
ncbi:MAG: HPr family phosphocarrier protein [Alphaproteobacteria bacterium]|nr:HPr family phosphocarrier protein [Alphaproteobacteria bacterium]